MIRFLLASYFQQLYEEYLSSNSIEDGYLSFCDTIKLFAENIDNFIFEWSKKKRGKTLDNLTEIKMNLGTSIDILLNKNVIVTILQDNSEFSDFYYRISFASKSFINKLSLEELKSALRLPPNLTIIDKEKLKEQKNKCLIYYKQIKAISELIF